jgi:hypothetical protein
MSLQEELHDPMADSPLDDRKQVKRRRTQLDKSLDERRATMKGILDVKEGRRLIWWILEQCGPMRLPLNMPAQGLPVDVSATMFNIGKVSIGNLLIEEILAAAPDRYAQMLTESKEMTDAG